MSRGSLWSLFGGRETAGASAVTIHNLTYQVSSPLPSFFSSREAVLMKSGWSSQD